MAAPAAKTATSTPPRRQNRHVNAHPAAGPAPLDPHERRLEWQLAALVLALFAAAGGGVVGAEGSVARPSATSGARRPGASRRRTGRLVRPPRSC